MGLIKSQFLSVRISPEDRQDFNNKCTEMEIKNPSEFVREMIVAFTEGRLKIEPTDKQKEIYNVN